MDVYRWLTRALFDHIMNLQARKTGKSNAARLKRAGAAPGKHSAIARIKGLARSLNYSVCRCTSKESQAQLCCVKSRFKFHKFMANFNLPGHNRDGQAIPKTPGPGSQS